VSFDESGMARSKSFLKKGARQAYDPIASIQKHKLIPKDESPIRKSPAKKSPVKKVETSRKASEPTKSLEPVRKSNYSTV
jgi:hypothetical protein